MQINYSVRYSYLETFQMVGNDKFLTVNIRVWRPARLNIINRIILPQWCHRFINYNLAKNLESSLLNLQSINCHEKIDRNQSGLFCDSKSIKK